MKLYKKSKDVVLSWDLNPGLQVRKQRQIHQTTYSGLPFN